MEVAYELFVPYMKQLTDHIHSKGRVATLHSCGHNEERVQCYIDGGVEYFFDYDILGGNYSTSKGIKVGSSRADVEAAYGAGEESGNMLIYNDGAKQLIFTLNGDTVSEIDFYVPV